MYVVHCNAFSGCSFSSYMLELLTSSTNSVNMCKQCKCSQSASSKCFCAMGAGRGNTSTTALLLVSDTWTFKLYIATLTSILHSSKQFQSIIEDPKNG